MRKILDGYTQREIKMQRTMLRLACFFLSLALVLGVILVASLTGCAPAESNEDAVLEDLEYSVGQEPVPFAEGRTPHYTALDGTIWYDNAGDILKENDMGNPWNVKILPVNVDGETINLYHIVCKHCDEVNWLPAQKIKQPCTYCGRMIKNAPSPG